MIQKITWNYLMYLIKILDRNILQEAVSEPSRGRGRFWI